MNRARKVAQHCRISSLESRSYLRTSCIHRAVAVRLVVGTKVARCDWARTVAWPPSSIRTERLVLRESEARDRAAFIELFASPEVGTYLGGARPRDELEREMAEVPGRRPGLFVVDLDGAMIGMVTLDRHDAESPGHASELAIPLGYVRRRPIAM